MTTPSDIVEKLHPPRLPVDFATLTWQDASAAVGIGLATGILLFLVFRLFLSRPPSAHERVGAALTTYRDLPSSERLIHQARLWSQLSTELGDDRSADAEWRVGLYKPGSLIDHDALDAEILRLARKKGG